MSSSKYERPERHAFYHTTLWKKTRQAYFESVNGLCERHLERDKYVQGKIIHHIEEITDENVNDVNITINYENLECLCYECHNKEHKKVDLPTTKGVKFGPGGKVILDYDQEE